MAVALLLKYFILGLSALLPLVNPPGSAIEFLALVGLQPKPVYKALARRISVSTVLFLAFIGSMGSYLLQFFGISLEILQVGGGIVVAAMGWSLLNRPESDRAKQDADMEKAATLRTTINWDSRVFYPLTFPVTVGPGSVAVMLTLSAHATGGSLGTTVFAHAGRLLADIVLCILVYGCYAYAPGIASKVSQSTVHGILLIIAFVLFCIGAQIAWNGLQPMLRGLCPPIR